MARLDRRTPARLTPRAGRAPKLRPGAPLAKAPTGVAGLDQLTGGGLPAGRPTLLCGGPGAGKTLLATQFLVTGARDHGEPGVFIGFEETADDLEKNVRSLGFDLATLERKKLLIIDHVAVDRREIQETGDYDLEGLFVRIGSAIDTIGARRVVLDTIEVLFDTYSRDVLRAEIQRLFRFLKDKGVTAVVTAEKGDGPLTRNGLEEYVSDCVIVLDHRVEDQMMTRRLRIVKYRGSAHGTNEYPFLIDAGGFSVMPITGIGLDYPVSKARVPTGVAALDRMLDGKGYFRGSTVLASGPAGTGKSSLAATFVDASCARGERALYFALEEPADQIVRNMSSIGVDLGAWRERGLLRIEAARPTVFGLEMHLVTMLRQIELLRPKVVVVDPISSLLSSGDTREVKSWLVRLFDFLKGRGVTGFVTCLTGPTGLEETDLGVSSLIDTWLEVRDLETAGERTRTLHILKSRGMPHSNQVREFVLGSDGIQLVDVYSGPTGVLTGSARAAHEATERSARVERSELAARRQRQVAQRRRILEAQIQALRHELETEEVESTASIEEEASRDLRSSEGRSALNRLRMSELPPKPAARKGSKTS
ncbi:MAG: circadian clock protein KaiC [Polyangiales bacterium]